MDNTIQPNGSLKIAFVQSCWHEDIVDRCREGFAGRWTETGMPDNSVDYFSVPGAFEIPLKAKQLAKSGDYRLIVAAGFVVDGGIYRHEFVAQAVISALMQVQLEQEIPVLSAVLTPKSFHASEEHQAFFRDHMVIKGREAADAAATLLASPRSQVASPRQIAYGG